MTGQHVAHVQSKELGGPLAMALYSKVGIQQQVTLLSAGGDQVGMPWWGHQLG